MKFLQAIQIPTRATIPTLLLCALTLASVWLFSSAKGVAQSTALPESSLIRMTKSWSVPITPADLERGVVQCQGSRWFFAGAWTNKPVVLSWDASSLETVHADGTVSKCDVRIELTHASEQANGAWSIVRSTAQTDHKHGVTTANVIASSERALPSEFIVTISLMNDQGEFLESGTYSANLAATSISL